MFAVSLMIVYQSKSSILFLIETTIPSTGLYINGFPATTYDTPNVIICSYAEIEAVTPSTELQAYKNLNVSSSFSLIILDVEFLSISIKCFIVKIFYTIQLLLEPPNH